jgi:hypothetical protein
MNDQLVPFQCSTNVCPPWFARETAKQLVVLAHDTPASRPFGGPGGLTLGAIVHTGVAPAGGATATTVPVTKPTDTANRRNADRRGRREYIGRLASRRIVNPRRSTHHTGAADQPSKVLSWIHAPRQFT